VTHAPLAQGIQRPALKTQNNTTHKNNTKQAQTQTKQNKKQEDERMVAALAELEGGGGVPRSWARVSAMMPWRTAKACAQRWLSCLAPALKAAAQAPWTEWEVAVL
jgi:uncharacterized protein YbbK (DUF523 family)